MKAAVAALILIPALAHADPVRVAVVVVDGPPGSDLERPGNDPVRIDQQATTDEASLASYSHVVGSQRGLVTGTALTVPEGHVELAARTAIVVSGVAINGGLTSTTELWADANWIMPLDEGSGVSVYGVGVKQVLGRGRSWQLAATGSIRSASDTSSSDNRLATVGGVVTMCSDHCGVMVTGGLSMLMLEGEASVPLVTLGVSVGSPKARLMGEVISALSSPDSSNGGEVMFFGFRFGGTSTSMDLGLLKAGGGEDGTIPILSVQTRL